MLHSKRIARRQPISLVARHLSARSFRHVSTKATLYYLAPLEEYKTTKPYHINIPAWALPPGKQSNEISEPYFNIPVKGLRGKESKFQLDINGFAVVKETRRGQDSLYDCISYEEYNDSEKVRTHVRPAVQEFLKRFLGAQDVIAFSTQIRRRDNQFPALPRGTNGDVPQPVQGVHVDFAPNSARQEITELIRSRGYNTLLGRRWQIISIWKPLFGPLQDWPLALLDYKSLDRERDLVVSDNVYTHVIRETYNVHFNKAHQWHYLENQQPDEILVFKSYDTQAKTGMARVCPHAAFKDPKAPPTARPRESFECQALVLYPEGDIDSELQEEVSNRNQYALRVTLNADHAAPQLLPSEDSS